MDKLRLKKENKMLHSLRKLVVVLAGAALMAAPVTSAQKITNINVTTIVYDNDTAGTQLLMRSDDYNAFQQASYTDTGGASSIIAPSNGAWQLYLGNQSLRTMRLTLSKPVSGSPPSPAPDGLYYANTEVYSACFNAANQETSFLVIPPGMANNRCSLGIDFSYNRIKYKLVMNPTISGTGWATVSCDSGSGTTCTHWTIVPNTTAGNGNVPTVAFLYQFTNKGLAYIGSYYNTYRIDVTNP